MAVMKVIVILTCSFSPPQLLNSTYVFSSARRSIKVAAGVQREVYDQLRPAFEELFDDVEEHALSILLEPWTLLVLRDREALLQVFLLISKPYKTFD